MTKFKVPPIETGVKIPGCGRPTLYPFSDMEITASRFYPETDGEKLRVLQSALSNAARRQNTQAITRRVYDKETGALTGVRVWRAK